ncbi:MAG: hypothetical protein PHT60_14905 [Acidiphilium sp.]|nr:hypothetical protein [Acidiphilium sp.]MDD4937051.1 hypothetical protein [Acidiphilium sp.]
MITQTPTIGRLSAGCLALSLALTPIPQALAQGAPGGSTANTGSTTGCAVLAQAAATGITAAIAANNQIVQAPQSVTQLSCLGNFFNGVGLNVITNLLNPANLLQDVEGKICGAATQAYQSAMGTAQCGLTITGFNLGGFGNLGFGNFCPSLNLGGGGPTIASIGTSLNGTGQSSLYVNGQAMSPTGYPNPNGVGP